MGQRFNVPDPFASPVGGGHQRGGEGGEGRSNIKALLRQRTLQHFNIPAPFALPPQPLMGMGAKGAAALGPAI